MKAKALGVALILIVASSFMAFGQDMKPWRLELFLSNYGTGATAEYAFPIDNLSLGGSIGFNTSGKSSGANIAARFYPLSSKGGGFFADIGYAFNIGAEGLFHYPNAHVGYRLSFLKFLTVRCAFGAEYNIFPDGSGGQKGLVFAGDIGLGISL